MEAAVRPESRFLFPDTGRQSIRLAEGRRRRGLPVFCRAGEKDSGGRGGCPLECPSDGDPESGPAGPSRPARQGGADPASGHQVPAHPAAHRRHVRNDARVRGHRTGRAAGARGPADLRGRRARGATVVDADGRRHRDAVRHDHQPGDRAGAATESTSGWEGCLSIPDIRGQVPRPRIGARARARSDRPADRAASPRACRRASSSTRPTTSTACCSSTG